MTMSKEAAEILMSTGTTRQGAKVRSTTRVTITPAITSELISLGLIGPEHGLTRKGSIEVQRRNEEFAF